MLIIKEITMRVLNKMIWLAFILTLHSYLLCMQINQQPTTRSTQKHRISSLSPSFDERTETIVYNETFENGNDGWSFIDGTIPVSLFHNYYSSEDGWAWWMGDSTLAANGNIGGYHNNLYLVLDTPTVPLPASNAQLTFRLKYNIENPSGTTSPYTGWDACNIRISTDNGNTWSIISGSPAYNISSAYSFGHTHGEGANIPGWGGNSNGWINASFDLNSYAGQSVKIRFAFASDNAYDTTENHALFGMMIDDIHIGDLINDGSVSNGFTTDSLVPVGGQLWHIAEVSDAPSPTHAMVCQNSNGSYNPNMLNYVVSPSIQLPANGDIKVDFQIKGDYSDLTSYPDIDTWGWEISPDNGTEWYPMWNPYNDPAVPNYIITDIPAVWTSVTEYYVGYFDGWISDYAGLTVKFRIYFKTNSTVDGTGMMIDDFQIVNTIPLPPPTNLTAISQNMNVQLNWSAPDPAVPPVTGYFVSRSLDPAGVFETIAHIQNPSVVTYTDVTPVVGVINYYQVTAEYVDEQSAPSNMATIFIFGPDYAELQYDDNEVDQGYNVGYTHSMVVRFLFAMSTPEEWEVPYVRVFVDSVGMSPLFFRLYDSDGVDNVPGTLLLQFTYPASSITQGWNIIPIPENLHISGTEGGFYVGILEVPNPSAIGLDTDSHNSSWKRMGVSQPWEQITEGNLMIRAIIRNPVNITDPLEVQPFSSRNYPNPFNPTTTIAFEIPSTSDVSLKIYNIKGQLVKELINGRLTPGSYKTEWDGKDQTGNQAASGVYFYRLMTSGKCITSKMLLLK